MPPHILSQIASERASVARIRKVCADRGHPIAAHALDYDAPEPTRTAPPIVPFTDPLATIREKLEDLDVLIRRGRYDEARAVIRELRALV